MSKSLSELGQRRRRQGIQGLPLTQDKNGETNKTVCIQLLFNQNIRTVPEFSNVSSFLKSSTVNFNISARITTHNQQFPEIKGRAIFGSLGVAGSAEVLWRT
jgi:hypothetical protein